MRIETKNLLIRFASALKPGLTLESLPDRRFTLSKDPLVIGETKIDGETIDDLLDEALANIQVEDVPKIASKGINQAILDQVSPEIITEDSPVPADIKELLGEDGISMISDFLDQISQYPFLYTEDFGFKKVWRTRSFSPTCDELFTSEEFLKLLTAALEMKIIKCTETDPMKFKIALEEAAFYHLIEIFLL